MTSDTKGQFDTDADGGAKKTFTAPIQPGEYPFHCSYHPNMKGTLIVKSPSMCRTRPSGKRKQLSGTSPSAGGVQATGSRLMPWMNADSSRCGLLGRHDVGYLAVQFLEHDA